MWNATPYKPLRLDDCIQSNDGSNSCLEELKCKLDSLVEDEVERDHIFHSALASDTATDCIIHYVTGFVCQKLLKCTGCRTCKLGPSASGNVTTPEADLVMCKMWGRLLHPNIAMFCLLKEAEHQFQNHARDKDVYDPRTDSIIDNYNLPFLCSEHKVDIMVQCECTSTVLSSK